MVTYGERFDDAAAADSVFADKGAAVEGVSLYSAELVWTGTGIRRR